MKRILTAFLMLLIFLTLNAFKGCGKKHVLNDKYPEKVRALFLGVERLSLTGKFKKGSFKSFFKELFSTTEFQKHKQRVIERVNELKGAFAETQIIAEKVLEKYRKKPDKRKIFEFYTLENVTFKTVPYLLDVPKGKIDRSFKNIKSQLKGDLILEIRPVVLRYIESGDSKEFEVEVDVIIFDLAAKNIIFRKTVDEDADLKKSFYDEEKLKKDEKPTPGFKKIRVTFNMENYKDGIRKLADQVAPEIIKLLTRPKKD